MKTQESLSKSADGALKDAIKNCAQLLNYLRLLQNGDTARYMPHVRSHLATTAQKAHEFNAYRNALDTE